MRYFNVIAAVAATMMMSGAAAAREKPEQPKAKKVCRTVEVSGRITPQRICRKVVPAKAGEESRRAARDADEAADRRE